MIGEVMHVTGKELFYSAMMLRLERLVNVEYLYPTSEEGRLAELEDAKQTLRKKKLLKENANGKIALDLGLIACASLCSNPESCEVKEHENGYHAAVYKSEETYMLMEQDDDGAYSISWFKDKDELDEHVSKRMLAEKEEGE